VAFEKRTGSEPIAASSGLDLLRSRAPPPRPRRSRLAASPRPTPPPASLPGPPASPPSVICAVNTRAVERPGRDYNGAVRCESPRCNLKMSLSCRRVHPAGRSNTLRRHPDWRAARHRARRPDPRAWRHAEQVEDRLRADYHGDFESSGPLRGAVRAPPAASTSSSSRRPPTPTRRAIHYPRRDRNRLLDVSVFPLRMSCANRCCSPATHACKELQGTLPARGQN